MTSLFNFYSFVIVSGVQVARLPTICKAPFDLYQIFNSVQHHGGFPNVSVCDWGAVPYVGPLEIAC